MRWPPASEPRREDRDNIARTQAPHGVSQHSGAPIFMIFKGISCKGIEFAVPYICFDLTIPRVSVEF
jgi:hypothetical protein